MSRKDADVPRTRPAPRALPASRDRVRNTRRPSRISAAPGRGRQTCISADGTALSCSADRRLPRASPRRRQALTPPQTGGTGCKATECEPGCSSKGATPRAARLRTGKRSHQPHANPLEDRPSCAVRYRQVHLLRGSHTLGPDGLYWTGPAACADASIKIRRGQLGQLRAS
jgi:hypothetical protein